MKPWSPFGRGKNIATRSTIDLRPLELSSAAGFPGLAATTSVRGKRLIDRYFKLTENQTTVKQETAGWPHDFCDHGLHYRREPADPRPGWYAGRGRRICYVHLGGRRNLVMGLYANYPIALAPGMSLNAYFTYAVCLNMHVPWQTALAVVFFSGRVIPAA